MKLEFKGKQFKTTRDYDKNLLKIKVGRYLTTIHRDQDNFPWYIIKVNYLGENAKRLLQSKSF